MFRQARTTIAALGVVYLFTLAGVLAVLFSVQRHFVAFDASDLLFAHSRLPAAHELATVFACATLMCFAGYAALVIVVMRENIRSTWPRVTSLLVLQLLIGTSFALLPIAIDSDQYAYEEYGYIAATGNPYVPSALPANAPSNARRIAIHWGNPLPADAYGGAWTTFNSLILAPFEGTTIAVQALVLRLTALLAACLVTLLIARSLPKDSIAAAAAFALNPLVFLEIANGAHNDIFLVLAGCAAAFAAIRAQFGLAGMALGLATAVKFAYAPFIAPLAALAYARTRSPYVVCVTIAGFVAVTLLFTLPFGWHGPLTTPFLLLQHSHGTFARLTPMTSVAIVAAMAALTFEASRGRVSSWLFIVTALLILPLHGKIEAWYPLITTPLLIVPTVETRCAFLAFTSLGLVLAQSSFLDAFPLVEAFASALATASVCAALFALRPRSRRLSRIRA